MCCREQEAPSLNSPWLISESSLVSEMEDDLGRCAALSNPQLRHQTAVATQSESS